MSLQFIQHHADTTEGFKREACFTLDYSRDRILHCVDQLSDEDIWWRPRAEMNAVGNILLHLCGNMRQWMVCGVGGETDTRDRASEFAERRMIPRAELREKFCRTVDDAKAAIMGAGEAELLRPRFVQIGQVTGMGAIFHSVSHLEGHAQEIIYATRLRLGERYRFKDRY